MKQEEYDNLCSKFENTDERRKHARNTILTIGIVAVGGVIAMVLVDVYTPDQYGQNHVGVNITAINGTTISTEGLISYLELNKSTPSSITLTVYRNGQKLNKTLNIK